MNRRQFGKIGVTAAAATAGSALAQGSAQSLYELRHYEMRNDLETGRLHGFFENHYLPMLKRRGNSPVGAFNVISGLHSPSIILLIPYESTGQLLVNTDLVGQESDFVKAWKEAEGGSAIPYVRYRSSLLKAFSQHPRIEVPSGGSHSVCELRTYESKDSFASAAKIGMFNEEEIQIFRDCGMHPVFFGEGVIGDRLPHLTYMIAFKDMDARQKAWDTFRTNDDWNRIKGLPKWANTVSVIHASFLSPTGYSEIR